MTNSKLSENSSGKTEQKVYEDNEQKFFLQFLNSYLVSFRRYARDLNKQTKVEIRYHKFMVSVNVSDNV